MSIDSYEIGSWGYISPLDPSLVSSWGYLAYDLIVDTVDDIVGNALELIIEQYEQSENMLALFEALLSPWRILDTTTHDMRTKMTLNYSYGVQLEVCGEIVGEDRLDRLDGEYREAIFSKIAYLNSTGTPDSVIESIYNIYDPEIVCYDEIGPLTASISIFSNEEIDPSAYNTIKKIMPVCSELELSSSIGGKAFLEIDEGEIDVPDYAGGFVDEDEIDTSFAGVLSELLNE